LDSSLIFQIHGIKKRWSRPAAFSGPLRTKIISALDNVPVNQNDGIIYIIAFVLLPLKQ
jgi:hypothetical protein